MICEEEARAVIDGVFEEQALTLGGLVAIREIDDDLVWRLVRNLDVIRRKALRRLGQAEPRDEDDPAASTVKPHPAIEEFLAMLRKA